MNCPLGLLVFGFFYGDSKLPQPNAKDVQIHSKSLRSIRYASEGNPLTTRKR